MDWRRHAHQGAMRRCITPDARTIARMLPSYIMTAWREALGFANAPVLYYTM